MKHCNNRWQLYRAPHESQKECHLSKASSSRHTKTVEAMLKLWNQYFALLV